jgi:uncharacterized membrane protein
MDNLISFPDKIWILLMKAGKLLGCHQRYDRSFFMFSRQFPICARCTGVLIGEWSALILLIKGFSLPSQSIAALLLLMGCDWGVQALKIRESTNLRRFLTGFGGGMAVMQIYYHFFLCLIKLIFNRG